MKYTLEYYEGSNNGSAVHFMATDESGNAVGRRIVGSGYLGVAYSHKDIFEMREHDIEVLIDELRGAMKGIRAEQRKKTREEVLLWWKTQEEYGVTVKNKIHTLWQKPEHCRTARACSQFKSRYMAQRAAWILMKAKVKK